MLSAVIFDLDDTLVDHTSAADEAAVSWARALGVDDPRPSTRWAKITAVHYERYQRRELTLAEQRRQRVRDFLGRNLDDASADAHFADYLASYESAWRAFDDAAPALRRVRAAGLGVGVLTNGDATQQRFKVERVGLTSEIDVLVASSELAAGKPDAGAFLHITRLLGVAPDDALMVGDSLPHDVHGALAAGLHATLLDRRDNHPAVDVRRIRSLDAIMAVDASLEI